MGMRKPVGVPQLRPSTTSGASIVSPAAVEPRTVSASASVGPSLVLGIETDTAGAGNAAKSGLTADPASPNEAVATESGRVERQRRGKKSAVYRHTEFHRLADDGDGRTYERRMCRYCDTVFSFKGGTTSAALRHLKTAHPERMMYAGLELPIPPRPAPMPAFQADQSPVQQPDEQENSAVVAPADSTSPEAPDHGQPDETDQRERRQLKRRRENSGDVEPGTRKPSSPRQSRTGNARPKLTASQMAITHFLQHHKDALSLAGRLKFAKHLTHHVSDAEMYNVLDDATRLAYIREFADDEGESLAV